MDEAVSVVWSSFTGIPKAAFHGYCFVDADYIWGESGMREYQRATGKRVGHGQDGCYVSVIRTANGVDIGTDAAGFRKLFYYSRDGVWCVSDSLVDMAEHLTSHGVRLTANFPQLAGMLLRDTIAKQLSSFGTMFNEIRLLPSYRYVRVDGRGLEVVDKPAQETVEYGAGLSSFVTTWVRRMETMLTDERIKLTIDLSGGADSRVNFAVLIAASRRLGFGAETVLLKSSTGKKWQADLKAAGAIAEAFGLSVNGKPWSQSAPGLSTEASYAVWRSRCLGTYRPIYPPGEGPTPFFVNAHGGGGENHRRFYDHAEPRDYLERVAVDSAHPLLARHWVEDVLADLTEAMAYHPSAEPLVAHYREFRSRIHAGRSANARVTMAPLSSVMLQSLMDAPASPQGAQVNFDAMESLVPGLMDLPYDSTRKAPTPEHRGALTTVVLDGQGSPGVVYVGNHDVAQPKGVGRSPDAWLELLDSEYMGSDREPVIGFCGRSAFKRSQKILAQSRHAGEFARAADGCDVSGVLAVSFAFTTTGI